MWVTNDRIDALLTKCPLQMMIQAVASLVLVLYSILHMVGQFKEIRASVDLQAKSWENLGNLPSFYMFHHRGKALSGNYYSGDE